MNRLKKRPPRPTAEELRAIDDVERMMSAATLIGLRILNRVSDRKMAEEMGLTHSYSRNKWARRMKRGWRTLTASSRLRKLELDLADGRLSTFQRYARGVGLRFDTKLVQHKRPTIRQLRSHHRTTDKLAAKRLAKSGLRRRNLT